MRSFSTRLRVFTFLVAVGGFLAASVVGMLALRGIDTQATSIAGNAVPSVLHLSQMRMTLIHIDQRLGALARSDTQPMRERQLAKLATARRELTDAWQAYKQNPVYPLERPLWPAVERALPALHRALDDFVRLAPHTDLPTLGVLRRDIRTISNDLTADLLELTDYNAEQARARAEEIRQARHRHVVTVLGLDALALAFALVTFGAAHRRIRRSERELERRVAELDEFAGRAAHDLMSPLSTANLALDSVVSSPAADPKLARMAERGKNGIARAQQVVQSLLAFARAGARPVPGSQGDAPEVVRTILEEFRPIALDRNVELRSEIQASAGELAVACDPVLLTVVLRNLVQNAVKYMPEDGRRCVTLRARAASPFVCLEVEDTGKGVPPELRQRVFEPYERGREPGQPGIGLGLATVRRIVEAHRGHVRLIAPPSGGSLFRVELPRAQTPADETDVPSWRRIARRLGVRTS